MSITDNSTLEIKSLHHDYKVTFDESVDDISKYIDLYPNSVVVMDRRIQELYGSRVTTAMGSAPIHLVTADETTKTLDGAQVLIDWLLEHKCNRSTMIIAIGGGIVQDLVTFTSNIFYRGTSFVLIPTTLLSMSDSCIGAKCGINYGKFKNQLGVIHAPRAVHIFSEFLGTLEERDIQSGYGEILKLAITGSLQNMEFLFDSVEKYGLRGKPILPLVRQSLEIKKVVIEADEYEADIRRILNYGHTFGHALEALTNHAIPHGLAVAWGIDLINYIASQDNSDLKPLFEDTHRFIKTHLNFQLENFPNAADLVDMIRRDKKMSNGFINLAIPVFPGRIIIRGRELDESLVKLVDQYLRQFNVYA